jgi:hypothetical protein
MRLRNQHGGSGTNVSRPRVDAKINILKDTYEHKIRPIVDVVNAIQKKLTENEKPQGDELIYFIKIYIIIKSVIDIANNAYLKILPMIFFAIEFPPELYIKNNDVGNNYKILYNQPYLTLKKYSERNNTNTSVVKYKGYHQSFLQSTKNNTTHDLLYDRLIGLDTITKLSYDPKLPKNTVTNMMFAIGASGTGKTTRYFGYKGIGGKAEDRVGILEYIINSKIQSNNNIKFKIAYFTCYGQTMDNKNDFNECVTFIKKENDDDFKTKSFIMNNDGDNDAKDYTDFYSKLMTKKLCEMNDGEFQKFAKGDNVTFECKQNNSHHNIIEILSRGPLYGSDIWMETNKDNVNQLEDLFNSLIAQQKKLRTIMPTINNVESSRCHTCILLKSYVIKKIDDQEIEEIESFFPLFDMAGTEDIGAIKKFLDKEDMKKILQHILTDNGDNKQMTYDNLRLTSLRQIKDKLDEKVNSFTEKQGGGSESKSYDVKTKLDNLNKNDIENMQTHLIDKISREGNYINHTIATLIFAVLCVGESMKAPIKNNGVDEFDNILTTVQEKMKKAGVCSYKNEIECGKSKYLYDGEINYNSILSKSSIWAQLIFGLLYSNNETNESIKELMKNEANVKKEYFYNVDLLYINEYNYGIQFRSVKMIAKYIEEFKKLNDLLNNVSVSNNVICINGKQYEAKYNDKNNDKNILVGVKTNGQNPCKNEIQQQFDINNEDVKQFVKFFDYFFNYDQIKSREILEDDKITDELYKKYISLIVNHGDNLVKDNKFTWGEQFTHEQKMYTKFDNVVRTICEKIFNTHFGAKAKAEAKTFLISKVTELIKKIMPETKDDIIKNINDLYEKTMKKGEQNSERLYIKKTFHECLSSSNNITTFKKMLNNTSEKNILNFYIDQKQNANTNDINYYKGQMMRVKERELSPPTMILMHCLTGEEQKNDMVKSTLDMCQSLYNSVDIENIAK